jgi:hypothetical protein
MPDMNTDAIKASIQENAVELQRLQKRVHETVRLRDNGNEHYQRWKAACAEFHGRYNMLAFPGGYGGALDRIMQGDEFSIEAGLCFLECRPYFFRSGYMYKDILRRLKRATLPTPQAARLQSLIVRLERWKTERRRKKRRQKIG